VGRYFRTDSSNGNKWVFAAAVWGALTVPLLQAEAAPVCPAGMSVTQDGKSCATDSASAASPGGSFDVLGNIMDTTKKEINAKEAVDGSKEDFFKSEYHKKYNEGYWEYFQANSAAKPGEYCTAMFIKKDFAVAILGPGGEYRGALMIFTPLNGHENFPQSEQPRVIKVTLKQASDPPATVGVFNFNIGAWESPAVAFAVPTIEAAMQGMEETLDFHLQHEGNSIGDIEWHSGVAARAELKKCLERR